MISISIKSLPSAIERLRERGPFILEAITAKMNELMVKLQSKVVGETIPQFFPGGAPAIAAAVQIQPATLEGTKIVGGVTATGPIRQTQGGPNAGRRVNIAVIQEEGVPHSWEIQPVLYGIAWARHQKKRALHGIGAREHGGMPMALAFMLGGKQVIVRRVLHPPLVARPFMHTAQQEMEAQIRAELIATFEGAFRA